MKTLMDVREELMALSDELDQIRDRREELLDREIEIEQEMEGLREHQQDLFEMLEMEEDVEDAAA